MTVDASDLTDEERAYLRAAANLLAEIAVAQGPVPMQCNANIAAMLGWDHERAKRVCKQIARLGLAAKSSHVREAKERALRRFGAA